MKQRFGTGERNYLKHGVIDLDGLLPWPRLIRARMRSKSGLRVHDGHADRLSDSRAIEAISCPIVATQNRVKPQNQKYFALHEF